MKQKLTLYSMVMIILETICLFTPYSFQEEHWKYDATDLTYHGIATLKRRYDVNIFGVSTVVGKILAIILIAVLAISFVAYLFSYLQKENKLANAYFYMPFISFILLIAFAFYAYAFAEVDTTNWRYEWTINWLFYIIISLHILTIVFSILLKFRKYSYEPKRMFAKEQYSANVVSSAADDIKKYKELLDLGIISQEEFDTKKKQLLGL